MPNIAPRTEAAKQKKTAAHILVSILAQNGIDRVSSVAGESYLPVLDALLDFPEIDVLTCRHEGGAGFMAESYGKLTGKPGICFVTRGPGACNASISVHTAMQDSTPMVLFMGQVARKDKGREAFQEIDVGHVFGSMTKWTAEISDPARLPEIVSHAMQIAVSGRPGPVVIALPEDILSKKIDQGIPEALPRHVSVPGKNTLKQFRNMMSSASRPVAIVGGSGWDDQSCADFTRFASACHLPVAASFRRQDLFDHRNNCYVGELGTGPNPKLVEKIKQADLILAAGTRLNEITTQGYTLLDPPEPHQTLIHVHPCEHVLGKVYTPDLSVQCDLNSFAGQLAASGFKIDGRSWAGWKDDLRGLYEEWSAIDTKNRPAWQGTDMTAVFNYLRESLPNDAVITTDAGNFSGWAQRYLYYGRPGRLLAPVSGAMGYAVPAAVSAAIAEPDKLTLGLCGDGGFMMTGAELATALHHGAKPIIIVCNNNMYGTIRMHQERDFPGRVSATALTNPDFVKLAESYGAFAARVEDASQFEAVWENALKSGKAALIEIKMDPAQITTQSAP